MHTLNFATKLCLFALFALFFAGCSNKDPIAPLSGTVTLSGSPIADCSVSFQPTGGKEMVAASGRTDAEGRFALETIESPRRPGAAIGSYKVKFSWVDPNFDESNPKPPPYKIPPKYQQEGIPFEVTAGGQTDVVFDLVP